MIPWSDPTEEVRRRIGQWPTADQLAERLLQVVEDQVEHAPRQNARGGGSSEMVWQVAPVT